MDSNHMQALIDGMSAQWQRERAETQMTLGKIIQALESMPSTSSIKGIGELASYRGYYSDLAFQPEPGERSVSEVLADCCAAMGKIFQGYKGGEFVMGELTPLWIADYGVCGVKVMDINADGSIETAPEDND